MPISEQGSFAATPAVEVVRSLILDEATGRLLARDENRKKALYFERGRPVGAKSNAIGETLARLALKRRLIDQATYDELLAAFGREKVRQGELMVRLGVPKEKVEALLRHQTAFRFAELCTWEAGHYSWIPDLPENFPRISTTAVAVFAEYVRLRYKPSMVPKLLAHLHDKRLLVDRGLAERFGGQIERHAATRPWSRLLTETTIDPHALPQRIAPADREALRRLLGLYTLIELGIVRIVEAADDTVPSYEVPRETEAEEPHPELQAELEALEGKNYFEILGISPEADTRAIKKAYFQLAKRYHPDRYFDHEHGRPSRLAERIFALINQAYEELKDPQRREAYRDYLERGTTEAEEAQRAEAILKSEVAFQKGMVLLKQRKYGEAITYFSEAIELHPEEPEYHVYAAWTQFLDEHRRKQRISEEAIRRARHALEQAPKLVEGWYLYGRMNKIAGRLEEAERAFRQVLDLDPNHREAKGELRSLEAQRVEMRAKGGLGKLFRKS